MGLEWTERVRGRHTGDALVQDVVGVQDIIEQLLAGFIEDQDFPL